MIYVTQTVTNFLFEVGPLVKRVSPLYKSIEVIMGSDTKESPIRGSDTQEPVVRKKLYPGLKTANHGINDVQYINDIKTVEMIVFSTPYDEEVVILAHSFSVLMSHVPSSNNAYLIQS